jgi:PAS domain S-box-containing protein
MKPSHKHTLYKYIRQNIDELTQICIDHLKAERRYLNLTPAMQDRVTLCSLELVAQTLETRDTSEFLASVRESELAPETCHAVLDILDDILTPQVDSLEDMRTLKQILSEGRAVTFKKLTQRLSELETREDNAATLGHDFLRRVIDVNPNFIFVRDRAGRFVLGNQAVAEAYGTTVDNLVGKTDEELRGQLPGEGRKQSVEHLRRDDLQIMESGQEKFIFEQAITDAEGNRRWLQTIKRPFFDEDGNIQYVFGVSSDITQRKELEQQIQESLERRAQQVQTSTEVAQEIADATELDELFHRVVTLIKERFGYYHAQIFRYDPERDAMVLVIGYGKAGEDMLAAGHQLSMGRGVVGTAAITQRPVLATDVTQDPDWLPNPFLPATKGELAVPIIIRHRGKEAEVLGILDVQQDVAGALTEEDQLLLEGLCSQIAIAIDATRMRQQLEEQLRELNAYVESAD